MATWSTKQKTRHVPFMHLQNWHFRKHSIIIIIISYG